MSSNQLPMQLAAALNRFPVAQIPRHMSLSGWHQQQQQYANAAFANSYPRAMAAMAMAAAKNSGLIREEGFCAMNKETLNPSSVLKASSFFDIENTSTKTCTPSINFNQASISPNN